MRPTIDRQIGERIERCRKAASLSRQDVADACGMSLDQYTAGEAGERTFSAVELLAIGQKVGFGLSDILSKLRL
ncbi:MAG: helix-turn-helix domain-containing protein [Hyphomicrobiaceae bacterium]